MISGDKARGEHARKSDLACRLGGKGLVRPVMAGLVSPAQVRGAPFAAARFAPGKPITQCPRIEQRGQQIESTAP